MTKTTTAKSASTAKTVKGAKSAPKTAKTTKTPKTAKASEIAVATKTAAAHVNPSVDQVKTWWPNARGEAILDMMSSGLPYFRAVRRTRRYHNEGKLNLA